MPSLKITETYWPALRDQLLHTDTTISDFSLTCTICYENVEPLNVVHHGPRDEPAHTAVVVPCGHIFGRYCIWAWASSFVGRTPPNCPTCRGSLIHPGCGHLVKAAPMPITMAEKPRRKVCPNVAHRPERISNALRTFSTAVCDFELDNAKRAALKSFPSTIPEGGVVRDICADCQVQGLLRVLTNLATPLGALSNLGADEFLGFAAKAGGERFVLFSQDRRRFATVLRDHEQYPEVLRASRELQTIIEDSPKQYWPTKDLRGIEFSLHVCTWENDGGWT